MGFIAQFILPKQVDFNAALKTQAHLARLMVQQLYKASRSDNPSALSAIPHAAQQARRQKSRNMKILLDVFLTPYDKESIYRMITQLDWVALSVRHFQLDAKVYGIDSLREYHQLLKVLAQMAILLEDGVGKLENRDLKPIARRTVLIHDLYDQVVELCANATARLLSQDDLKRIIRHQIILLQAKDIAMRIHVAANTLEDMAIKVV